MCTTPPPGGPQAAAHAHSFPSPPAGGPLSCEFSLTQESQAFTPQLPAHPSSPKLPHKALRTSTWAKLQAPHGTFGHLVGSSHLSASIRSLAPGLTMFWSPGLLPVFPQGHFLLWGLPHSLEGSLLPLANFSTLSPSSLYRLHGKPCWSGSLPLRSEV